MLAYRCYICSHTLGDGIPPVEALSTVQVDVVGGAEDAPQRFDVLNGTKFEGMSSYSFCAFCLVAIRDLPQVFSGDVRDRFIDFVQSGRPDAWAADASDEMFALHYAFDWTYASRMQTLLAGALIYKNYDFSLIHSLITEEAV